MRMKEKLRYKYILRREQNLENREIVKVSGPLVVAENMEHANVFDVVKVTRNLLVK